MKPGTLKLSVIACAMALYAGSSFALDYGDPGWSSLPTKTQQQILQIDQINAQFGYTSPGYRKYLIIQKQNAAPSTTAAHTPAATPATTPVSNPAPSAPTTPATSGQCADLGLNLEGISYYSASMPFVDLMKASSGWTHPGGSAYSKQPIQEDQYGNPLSLGPDGRLVNYVSFFVWQPSLPTLQNPSQPYVMTWDGNGLVSTSNAKVISNNFHRVVFQVTNQRFFIDLNSTDAADPVRNVRIVPLPMEHSTQVFSTDYLNSIRNFSTYRFMDWNNTNDSTIVHWSQRTTPQSVTQAVGGVAYEYMIQLANQLNADLWVNVPLLADDNYIQQMAQLFHSQLNPGRTVYVEYSNEVWNSGTFTQYNQLKPIAQANGLTGPAMVWQQYSARVAQIADVWHGVFGNSSSGPKVKVLMAGQLANPWILMQELAYHNNGYKVDGATAAFYVGGYHLLNAQNEASFRSYTPEQLDNAIINQDLPYQTSLVQQNLAIVKPYKLPFYFYEGGQSLQAAGHEPDGTPMNKDTTMVSLEQQANHLPMMTTVYEKILSAWKASGVGLFMLYDSTAPDSQYGFWGLRQFEYTPLDQAPKLQGVYNFCGWK